MYCLRYSTTYIYDILSVIWKFTSKICNSIHIFQFNIVYFYIFVNLLCTHKLEFLSCSCSFPCYSVVSVSCTSYVASSIICLRYTRSYRCRLLKSKHIVVEVFFFLWRRGGRFQSFSEGTTVVFNRRFKNISTAVLS